MTSLIDAKPENTFHLPHIGSMNTQSDEEAEFRPKHWSEHKIGKYSGRRL